MHPGTQEIGGIGDPDDPGAGAPQFVDDRVRQWVVTTDNDLAVKLKDLAHGTQPGCFARFLPKSIATDGVVRHDYIHLH
jgi:hypothetical protein